MYLTLYVVFGILFVAGTVGYWVFTRPFIGMDEHPEKKDPEPT